MSSSILVVDRHEGVADALAHLFAGAGFEPVHVANHAPQALELVDRVRPGVVTVDVVAGDDDGPLLLARLRSRFPHLPVLVISGSGSVAAAMASLDAGADAFVPKSATPGDLVAAARAAAAGHTWLPVPMLAGVIHALRHPPPPSDWEVLVSSLSPREHEVLGLMVDGLGRREIADRLTISLNTVRTHVKNILAKLGVHASLEAVSLGLRAGLRPRPVQPA